MDFKTKKQFFSLAEQRFFKSLNRVVPEKYLIFPKVRLSDVITCKDEKQILHLNFMHVDFLICDSKGYLPVMAIELDDNSHNWPERAERDKFFNDMFKQAGLKVFHQKFDFQIDEAELKEKLQKLLSK